MNDETSGDARDNSRPRLRMLAGFSNVSLRWLMTCKGEGLGHPERRLHLAQKGD